jgi:hypothetical protein
MQFHHLKRREVITLIVGALHGRSRLGRSSPIGCGGSV